jgi:3-oxoacyl-[acyl-carrier protein] reductase
MTPSPPPLDGRIALVTGVSRTRGIGAALVRRLLGDGASVLATGWDPHDAEVHGAADPAGRQALLAGVEGRHLLYHQADLALAETPEQLIELAVSRFGGIDIVVANHARSSSFGLEALTAAELDLTWAVNTRSTVLLAQHLLRHRPGPRPGGRFLLFTSGQHLGPMPGEIPYIATKGANLQLTWSLSEALIDHGITVNCVNPGPVDSGAYPTVVLDELTGRFPAGRWGQPDDVANLVAWLVSDQAGWITGQVLNSEGGFRR